MNSILTRTVRLKSLIVPLLSFPNPIPATPATNTLQVLAALHILGRGSCFDDISQLSLMSKSMVAATVHKFCKNFAEDLFEEHIYLPTGTYQDKVMYEYHKPGFTGGIGSTDVAHVGWSMCPFTLGHSFTGKEGFPTIAFQVTVDHTGRALAVTKGFTGATNDETIIRYDAAVTKIKTDTQYKDREYKLRKADGTFRERKECYLIVDNGYHEVKSRKVVVAWKRLRNWRYFLWSFMIHIVKHGVPHSFGERQVVNADTRTMCVCFCLFTVKMCLH